MIGKGHPDVMNYPYSFIVPVLESIGLASRENIVNGALAHKGGKSDDFEAFSDMIMNIGIEKSVDHSSNMTLLTGGFKK